jgi:hypothetical protein
LWQTRFCGGNLKEILKKYMKKTTTEARARMNKYINSKKAKFVFGKPLPPKVRVDPWFSTKYTTEIPITPALDRQISGDHYKDMPIQYAEFVYANKIPGIEAAIIKYICRWRVKNKEDDLKKAKHYIEILIELQKKWGD